MAPPPSPRSAVAAIPATCGELVQGSWQGVPCLVSCPIDMYSVARVTLAAAPGGGASPEWRKTSAALRAGLDWLGEEKGNGRFRIESPIPRGRGYGSSTADIGAVLYALAAACGKRLPARQAAQLATQIEPSDGTLVPGLVMFDHVGGHYVESLPATPPLTVLVIDPGGEVDTLRYHRRRETAVLNQLAPIHERAFRLLRQGLRRGDWRLVGRAATLSAQTHQQILFNPLLDQVLALAGDVEGLGVCRAHSGTLLGILLDPRRGDAAEIARHVRGQLPPPIALFKSTLVEGGPRFPAAFPPITSLIGREWGRD